MTVTLFGLKTCDTCRKARKELDAAGISHTYVDVRADGIEPGRLNTWAEEAGWQTLLNTKSATWRGLPEGDRSNVGEAEAIALMTGHPTLIKRPVIESGASVLVGWTSATKDALGL